MTWVLGAVYVCGWIGAVGAISRDKALRRWPRWRKFLAAIFCGLLWPAIYIISRVCEQLTEDS